MHDDNDDLAFTIFFRNRRAKTVHKLSLHTIWLCVNQVEFNRQRGKGWLPNNAYIKYREKNMYNNNCIPERNVKGWSFEVTDKVFYRVLEIFEVKN